MKSKLNNSTIKIKNKVQQKAKKLIFGKVVQGFKVLGFVCQKIAVLHPSGDQYAPLLTARLSDPFGLKQRVKC